MLWYNYKAAYFSNIDSTLIYHQAVRFVIFVTFAADWLELRPHVLLHGPKRVFRQSYLQRREVDPLVWLKYAKYNQWSSHPRKEGLVAIVWLRGTIGTLAIAGWVIGIPIVLQTQKLSSRFCPTICCTASERRSKIANQPHFMGEHHSYVVNSGISCQAVCDFASLTRGSACATFLATLTPSFRKDPPLQYLILIFQAPLSNRGLGITWLLPP